MTVDIALARLRNDEDPAIKQLAVLLVHDITETPLKEIATPQWLTGQITAFLKAATATDVLSKWVERKIQEELSRFDEDARPVRELIPKEALPPLKKLIGTPYTPSEDLVIRSIDHPALRQLLAIILTDTLTRFRKRISNVDKGLLGGLGKRAARRSKGLFGNLTGVAENIVGAVRDEVETSFDGRIKEFTSNATSEAVKTSAKYIADPEHSEAFASFRLAVLDVFLDTPLKQWVSEADKLSPESIVEIVVQTVRSALAHPDFEEQTTRRISTVMEEAGDGSFGAWLEEVDLKDTWTNTTVDFAEKRLRSAFAQPAFEAWFRALHEPSS